MKSKKGILVGAIATIALCVSIVTGATFALFTSETKTNVVVKAGTVSVTATIKDELTATHGVWNEEKGIYEEKDFLLAGENAAALDEKKQTLTLDNIVPTDKVSFTIAVKNDSTVPIKYRTIVACTKDDGLAGGLSVTIDEQKFTTSAIGEWTQIAAKGEIADVNVTVELPFDADNKYQNKSCTLSYKVEAVQANGKTNNGVTITGGSMALNNNINVGVADGTSKNLSAVYATGVGTSLTILGGTYDGGSKAEGNNAIWADNGAKVTIKGGTFDVGKDKDEGSNSTIYASNGSEITIEGGIFKTQCDPDPESNKYRYVLNVRNKSKEVAASKIIVKGGSFLNFDPRVGDDVDGKSVIFVAEGFKVEEKENTEISGVTGTWYVVVPA